MASETEAPLQRVELFEDRVGITRVVTLTDETTVLIGPLSPLIRPGGLLVEASSPLVLVEEVQLERRRVEQEVADGPSLQALRELVREAERVRDAASRAHAVAEATAEAAQTRWEAAADCVERAYAEASDPAKWLGAVKGLYGQCAEARQVVLDTAFALSDAERELEAVQRRLYDARAGQSVLRTYARLRIQGPAGTEVKVRYTIPCAAWRPVHRATLSRGRVTWQLAAMVWNATGEAWQGADVVCSTARPGQRATPPVLSDDRVRAVKRGKDVVVQEREEAVTVARESSARAVDSLPGVDDGGEARTFTAVDPPELPSTGRPVRIELDQWETDAVESWLSAPEQSEALVRVTQLHNAGSRPLLAGPVELVGQSGVVGRTRVGLVPPGEPFTLGWGAHDDVRVRRTVNTQRSDARISGRSQTRIEVRVDAHNSGDVPVTARIRERIPVSELAAVTVNKPTVQPVLAMGPDADGFCEWELSLRPGETQELRLDYTVDAASHVTLNL